MRWNGTYVVRVDVGLAASTEADVVEGPPGTGEPLVKAGVSFGAVA